MLCENIVRLRKEKGLTQEALAVKVHVVRQTISKWEKGTAVPDADQLCDLAEAMDVSVEQLLGRSSARPAAEQVAESDAVALARTLAEINEQLAVRNRFSQTLWKVIGGVLLAIVIFFVVLVVTNLVLMTKYHSHVETVAVEEEVFEVDEATSIPLLSSAVRMDDYLLCEALVGRACRDDLYTVWGEPTDHRNGRDYWDGEGEYGIAVAFDRNGIVAYCGKESGTAEQDG